MHSLSLLFLALVIPVVAASLWRGFLRASAVPVHMIPGEHRWDGWLLGLAVGVLPIARIGVAPLVIFSGAQPGLAAVGCGLVLFVVLGLRGRRARSCAAPMLEDGVWLLGCTGVGLVVQGGAGGAVLMGGVAGVVGLVALLLLQWTHWGRGSAFWISARSEFQVFAPNPDNRYAVGRIRVGAEPCVAVVPDNGSPYPAIGVYDLQFRRVRLARWDQVRALFDEHGTLRVQVGLEEDPSADLCFVVPPGRYFLTVRNYLCDHPEAPLLPRHVR